MPSILIINTTTNKGNPSRLPERAQQRTNKSYRAIQAMASPSSSLSVPLQLLPCGTASSSRVGLRALHRPSTPSVRLQPARGRQPTTAVSNHDDASAGHGGDAIAAATSILLLHQVGDDAAVAAELRAARTAGRAPQGPKGRPAGKPKEGGGGSGGKIHPAPTSAAKRALGAPAPPPSLPKEGSGGQEGSIH